MIFYDESLGCTGKLGRICKMALLSSKLRFINALCSWQLCRYLELRSARKVKVHWQLRTGLVCNSWFCYENGGKTRKARSHSHSLLRSYLGNLWDGSYSLHISVPPSKYSMYSHISVTPTCTVCSMWHTCTVEPACKVSVLSNENRPYKRVDLISGLLISIRVLWLGPA